MALPPGQARMALAAKKKAPPKPKAPVWIKANQGPATFQTSPLIRSQVLGGINARTTPLYAGALTAPAASGGGGGGASGVLGDYLNQMRADSSASSNADRGSMINNLRQAIISYGLAPDYSALGADAQGYLKEALDPNTLDLAAKNEKEGISSHARLGHENDLAMRRIPAMLAGRGILHSGQTGSDLGEQAQTFKNQGYDMLSALMQGITGSVGQFQEAERQRQRDLAEQEMQSAMQAAGDWGDSGLGGGYGYQDSGGYSSSIPALKKAVAAKKPVIKRQPIVAPSRKTAVYRPGVRRTGGV